MHSLSVSGYRQKGLIDHMLPQASGWRSRTRCRSRTSSCWPSRKWAIVIVLHNMLVLVPSRAVPFLPFTLYLLPFTFNLLHPFTFFILPFYLFTFFSFFFLPFLPFTFYLYLYLRSIRGSTGPRAPYFARCSIMSRLWNGLHRCGDRGPLPRSVEE